MSRPSFGSVAFGEAPSAQAANVIADAFRARAVLGRCVPAAEGWAIDFFEVGGDWNSPIQGHFREYLKTAPPNWTVWNPLKVESEVQNRVRAIDFPRHSKSDVAQRLYAPLGLTRQFHVAAVVCEGSRFDGWLGLWRDKAFTRCELAELQHGMSWLRNRISLERQLRSRLVSWNVIEALIGEIGAPAFLMTESGSIELANQRGLALLGQTGRALRGELVAATCFAHSAWRVTDLGGPGQQRLRLVVRREWPAVEDKLASAAARWSLTRAQSVVLRELASGLTNKEIAAKLQRAEGTIELHVSALLRAARVDSRSKLLVDFWQSQERS